MCCLILVEVTIHVLWDLVARLYGKVVPTLSDMVVLTITRRSILTKLLFTLFPFSNAYDYRQSVPNSFEEVFCSGSTSSLAMLVDYFQYVRASLL